MKLQDELMLALHNLVKLKEHKDEKGKDEFYTKHQRNGGLRTRDGQQTKNLTYHLH